MSSESEYKTDAVKSISVVIPVYNEKECLPDLERELVAALDPINIPYEVILVDDCSSDGSLEIIKKICEERSAFRFIRFKKNCGQSAAISAGFRSARGEITVTLDADLQNNPADIPLLLERMNEADCVCGWRKKRNDNWVRKVSTKVARLMYHSFLDNTVTDTGCSLKAYRTEYLQKIHLFRGAHRYLPTLMKMAGAKVAEVPVDHRPRTKGSAKYGVWNRLFVGVADLRGVGWLKKRVLGYKVEEENGKGLAEGN